MMNESSIPHLTDISRAPPCRASAAIAEKRPKDDTSSHEDLRLAAAAALCFLLASCPDPNLATDPPASLRSSYAVTVKAGYGQESPVAFSGLRAGTVFLDVMNPPSDLGIGFIGDASRDAPLEVAKGGEFTATLAVTAVDAESSSYSLKVGLYALAHPDDPVETGLLVGQATLSLSLTVPVIDVSLVQSGSADPATLAETWILTNRGEDLDSLTVSLDPGLASQVRLEPAPVDLYLAAGDAFEFRAIPLLYPGMGSLSGEFRLSLQPTGTAPPVPVDFVLPPGSQVRIGFGASGSPSGSGGRNCLNSKYIPKDIGKMLRPYGNGPDRGPLEGLVGAYKNAFGGAMRNAGSLGGKAGVPGAGILGKIGGAVFDGIGDAISDRMADAGVDPAYYKSPAVPTDPRWIDAANYDSIATIEGNAAYVLSGAEAAGASTAQLAAMNALLAQLALIQDIAEAGFRSLDRYNGAVSVNSQEWRRKQNIAFRIYMDLLASRMRAYAGALREFVEGEGADIFGASLDPDADILPLDYSADGSGAWLQGLTDLSEMGTLNSAADLDALEAAENALDPDAVAYFDQSMFWRAIFDMDLEYWEDFTAEWPGDLLLAVERLSSYDPERLIVHSALSVRFEPPAGRVPILPFDTTVSLNGRTVGTILNKVPEGIYVFDLASFPGIVGYLGAFPGGNRVVVEAPGFNPGVSLAVGPITLYAEHALHGELVIAADQAAADAAVSSGGSMNHDKADLVLAANGLPDLKRSSLATTVNLPLSVWNFGSAASPPSTVRVWDYDPFDPDSGAAELLPAAAQAVGSIPVWGSSDVVLSLPRAYLTGPEPAGIVLALHSGDPSLELSTEDNFFWLNAEGTE